jgi:hypothetical protein
MAGQATESERKNAGVAKPKKLCSGYPQSDGIHSESARKSSGSVKTSKKRARSTSKYWELSRQTSNASEAVVTASLQGTVTDPSSNKNTKRCFPGTSESGFS